MGKMSWTLRFGIFDLFAPQNYQHLRHIWCFHFGLCTCIQYTNRYFLNVTARTLTLSSLTAGTGTIQDAPQQPPHISVWVFCKASVMSFWPSTERWPSAATELKISDTLLTIRVCCWEFNLFPI